MRPSERVAKDVIEAVLQGTTMQFRPDQGDGSHDFNLLRGTTVFGAVEVTSAADQPRKSLIASMADGRKGGYDVPAAKCRSSWLVELLPDASVNRVRRDIDEYLAAVESDRLTGFTESDVSRYPSVERVVRELRVDSAWPWPSRHPRVIRINPPTDSGWLDSGDVRTAVETEALKDDNRRKLAKSGAAERHLFVYLDPTSSAARVALVNNRVPNGAPAIPEEVTHVWAATESGEPNEFVVVRAERLGGWELLRVRV